MPVHRWAALLRGVNVGGNRKLAMSDLKSFILDLGFSGATTLLASGNVVFEAAETDGAALQTLLEREARKRLGLETDFLLRDPRELAAAIAANPFAEAAGARPGQLVVAFAREKLPGDLPERILAFHPGPERIGVDGRHLYVDFVEGQGRSRLPQAMAKLKLGNPMTGRNWNSVLKLRAMLAS
jgi:uncharacterized protein (DUF1697 family)